MLLGHRRLGAACRRVNLRAVHWEPSQYLFRVSPEDLSFAHHRSRGSEEQMLLDTPSPSNLIQQQQTTYLDLAVGLRSLHAYIGIPLCYLFLCTCLAGCEPTQTFLARLFRGPAQISAQHVQWFPCIFLSLCCAVIARQAGGSGFAIIPNLLVAVASCIGGRNITLCQDFCTLPQARHFARSLTLQLW